MTNYENVVGWLFVILILALAALCSIIATTTAPKTSLNVYNKAYEQCLTEQQNNTKITNKEYYCVNYANAKVK